MVLSKHLTSSLALVGVMSCAVMAADVGRFTRSIGIMPQDRGSFDVDTFTAMGDIDLDGVSSSIGDLALYSAFMNAHCVVDPGPWPPPENLAQSDINCDGLIYPNIGDWAALWLVIVGEIEPCYGGIGAPTGDRLPVLQRSSNSEAYAIEVTSTELFAIDTGWVDIVITGGTERFCGFQFHLEYGTAGMELLDVQIGEAFSQWPYFYFYEDLSGVLAELRLAGTAQGYDSTLLSLLLPPLPVTLARLKFGITAADDDIASDINFVWGYCGDNALAVCEPIGIEWTCFGPDYLAVSQEVFDAENNNITGISERYGGADDVCLLGGPSSQPVRFVDFKSGRLTYTPCCQGIRGNVDGAGEVNVADLTFLVDFLFFSGPEPPCPEESDVDGSGATNVADLTYLVEYLFFSGPPPPPCP